MKKIMTYWLIASSLILMGIIGYEVWSYISKPKIGYVLNQQLFENFAGKQELEARLSEVKKIHKTELDSLYTLSQSDNPSPLVLSKFKEKQQQYADQEKSLSARYTRQIWGQINDYVKQYGDEHGYDMIFGATGDGSLMYSRESKDITEVVTKYINQKYEGQ